MLKYLMKRDAAIKRDALALEQLIYDIYREKRLKSDPESSDDL